MAATLVIVGVVVGFVDMKYAPQENSKFKREKRNLALAFSGEISALMRIVELREYVNGIENALQHMRQTREPFLLVPSDHTRVL